jgi:hypothetical protein
MIREEKPGNPVSSKARAENLYGEVAGNEHGLVLVPPRETDTS